MKKRLLGILLSFALMLTMMPALGLSQETYAEGQTVVWSGEQAVTQDNPVSIDKDKFSGIKLGDKIVVEFKDADGGLLSLFSNGKCLPGTSYNYVGSWDSAYEVFATQDMIKSLKQYGMDVSGYGYTVTKVSYEAGRDNLDVNTVWSGNFWMDSWSTLELSATSFSDVDWDEIEAIRFISEAGRSNWTLNIRSSWDDDGKIADQGSMTNIDYNNKYGKIIAEGTGFILGCAYISAGYAGFRYKFLIHSMLLFIVCNKLSCSFKN